MSTTTSPRRAERANGLATRLRIRSVALNTFAASGYAATSLRQIALAAEVDLATLKYHFGDKAGLFAEVYWLGHDAFVRALGPVLEQLATVQTRAELRAELRTTVSQVHDFLCANLPFARLAMFRLLDSSSEPIALSDQLEADVVGRIDRALIHLTQRRLVRAVDTRALLLLLVTSLSMWLIAARARPDWLGEPRLETPAGRERFCLFFTDLLEQHLLVGPAVEGALPELPSLAARAAKRKNG